MKKISNSIIYFVLFLFMSSVFIGCSDKEWNNHTDGTLTTNMMSVIENNSDLSIFASVLKKTGYDSILSLPVNYTVFAPKNSAWSGIDTTNVETLKKIVAYQICRGKNLATETNIYNDLTMLNTKHLRYDSSSKTFAEASIVSADNIAGNGVMHKTDKVFDMKDNIYDYITSTYPDLKQVKYLISLNHQVMDEDKSVQTGVSNGQAVYDTVWTNANTFLKNYPIDNEDSIMTYIVLQDAGFDQLYSKYSPYFIQPGTDSIAKTDSVVRYNICHDFVISISGKVDITQYDTITNADGIKIPIKGSTIVNQYEASNGRVYVIDKSSVLLKEKIQPIVIEGENYSGSADSSPIYLRNRTWASGGQDVMVNCKNSQTDTVHVTGSRGQDSTYTSTWTFYYDASNYLANTVNYYLKYKAKINSVNYKIYYVAYDDIAWHSATQYHIFKLKQKLFISMPGKTELAMSNNAVINNYLGNTTCFVGVGTAGVHEETKLTKWTLGSSSTQLLSAKVTTANNDVMVAPTAGTLTMWLCNTTTSTSTNLQGMLFLDYIKLVPILPAE